MTLQKDYNILYLLWDYKFSYNCKSAISSCQFRQQQWRLILPVKLLNPDQQDLKP